MPPWLTPLLPSLAAGAAGVVGGLFQNRSNARQARENRQFQERMSSTAAQRSAQDYAKAGFNPALAYERPASSPGGSVAQMEDALGKGISSGSASYQMRKQLELQAKSVKTQENMEMNDRERTSAQAQLAGAQVDEVNARAAQARALQPHMVQAQELSNEMQKYQNTMAKFDARFAEQMGSFGPVLRMIGPVLGRLAGPLAGLMQKPAPRGGITINNRVKP